MTGLLKITTKFLQIATGITKFPHLLQIDYNGQIGVARRVFQLKFSVSLILSGLFASDCKGTA